jgi:DNA-binding PadR family transcriptional regulator
MQEIVEVTVRSRSESLEFALLGLLRQEPLHGYVLRKRLSAIYGPLRALSFSVLYPQLKRMLEAGLISQAVIAKKTTSQRTRLVYSITEAGLKKFEESVTASTSMSWEDENFDVHVAFFSPTPVKTRLKILEGRKRRLQERADLLRADIEKSAVGLDKYLIEWRRHSLETAEREIAWLEKMIISERKSS